MENRVLCILGMHRSGTSLVGRWLSENGLFLGYKLLGADYANTGGHFEDMEILKLHNDILEDNGCDYKVQYGNNEFNLPESNRQVLDSMIHRRSADNYQWGWKEPRTCLFLDHWESHIPALKYLVVYRRYEEVIDSLLRRDQGQFINRRNFVFKYFQNKRFNNRLNQYADNYLSVWNNYNNAIINHLKKIDNKRYLVIGLDDLNSVNEKILKHLTSNWGFNLANKNINEVMEHKSLSKNPKFHVNFSQQGVDIAHNLWKQLKSLEKESINQIKG